MKRQDFIAGSIIAVGIAAAIICTGIVTGFPGAGPSAPADAAGTAGAGTISQDTGTYLRIDPVGEKNTGDLLIIMGTTNLPAGTALMITTGNHGQNSAVRAGTGGVNQFSAPVDTTTMKPGEQAITVTNMIGSPDTGDYRPGTITAKSTFTLKGSYRAVDTPVQATAVTGSSISLDPVGDKSAGDQFLVTGTTTLPVGTEILLQIMPDTGAPVSQTDKTAMGMAANSMVTRGEGPVNRISFAVDLSGQKPGRWVILVGKMGSEPFVVEDPVAAEYFLLR